MTTVDVAGFMALDETTRAELWDQLRPDQREALNAAIYREVGRRDPLAALNWAEWNQAVVPDLCYLPDSDFHREFWEWSDAIVEGVRPTPFLALWFRGGTKSTKAEILVAKLGCRSLRSYALYVSFSQDQADDHVATIGAILESDTVAEHYPAMARPRVGKHGNQRGWRRNRLWTDTGFVVDAMGLDTAGRGAKLGKERPDLLILDDIDATHASAKVVAKNMHTITQVFIPALQADAVIMMAQNTVAPNSIASQLADGRADFLADAIRSGPMPAIDDMTYERRAEGGYRVSGVPTWPEGYGLDRASDAMTDMGPEAFIIEVQQDTTQRPGAIWRKGEIHYWAGDLPEFDLIVVGVDPNKTGRSDDAGIVVVGRHHPPLLDDDGEPMLNRRGRPRRADPIAVVLDDLSGQFKPSMWRDEALRAAIKWGADEIVHEAAGLGEHSELTLKGSPLAKDYKGAYREAPASSATGGKKDRARPVWRLYVDRPDPRVYHARKLKQLELQQTTWEPDNDPMSPGALDACVHAIGRLLLRSSGVPNLAVAGGGA